MFDVGALVADPDFTQTITRLRPTTTSTIGGATTTYGTPTAIVGCVQPLRDADAQLLPEGTRLADCQVVYTAGDVRLGDAVTQEPDILVIGGVRYRVIHEQDYRQNGYVRVIVSRYPVGTIPSGGTP